MFHQDMTIYNRVYVPELRRDVYQRTILSGVFWDETGAINRIASGIQDIDEVTIVIPFAVESEREYLSPDEFDREEDKSLYYTIKPQDRVIKGEHEYEIVEKVSELDELFDAHIILSVDKKDFGTSMLRHWEVGAK